jgi:hypothetical protein
MKSQHPFPIPVWPTRAGVFPNLNASKIAAVYRWSAGDL